MGHPKIQDGQIERFPGFTPITAECTRRAVDLDRSYQMRVLDHPDLEPLRASWCGEK